jgi:glycosyltransferase involved in cell wall biosynthesis
MRHGLPVVTADRGGPAWIVDESCGFRVPVTDPDRFARDIAAAVRRIALSPDLARRLGDGAREKVAREGLWPAKAARMAALYEELAAPSGRRVHAPKG